MYVFIYTIWTYIFVVIILLVSTWTVGRTFYLEISEKSKLSERQGDRVGVKGSSPLLVIGLKS